MLYMFKWLNKCLHIFKKEWNVKSSLIEVFAILILLSNAKILDVTFNILTPTYLYNMNSTYGHPCVYNDSHTEYLSKQHMPYFVLVIAMSFVFNFCFSCYLFVPLCLFLEVPQLGRTETSSSLYIYGCLPRQLQT